MFVKSVYNFEKIIERFNIHRLSVAVWYLLKYYLNFTVPIYYRITKRKEQQSVRKYTNKIVIVSFTTFPARMKTLPVVIESLLRQTVKPDRIILWLADTQYPDKEKVTALLKPFISQGLEVKYCDDLRSHKKYYYSMKNNPEAIVVTVDDDIIYPEDMLEKLLKAHKIYPNCIVANRVHRMKFNNNGPLPYSKWDTKICKSAKPDLALCPTGCGGVLYPPHSLDQRVFDKKVFKNICIYADDLWLKCMSFMKGTQIVLSESDIPEIIDVIGNKKNGLAKVNVEQDLNTTQLNNITKYYSIDWSEIKCMQ